MMMRYLLIGLGLLGYCGAALATGLEPFVGALASVLGGAGSAIATGVAGAALGSKLFGGSKAPAVKPPAAMPTPDDEAVKAARRRQIAEMQARSGRASTILTAADDNKLGG